VTTTTSTTISTTTTTTISTTTTTTFFFFFFFFFFSADPFAPAYLTESDLARKEVHRPLMFCSACGPKI